MVVLFRFLLLFLLQKYLQQSLEFRRQQFQLEDLLVHRDLGEKLVHQDPLEDLPAQEGQGGRLDHQDPLEVRGDLPAQEGQGGRLDHQDQKGNKDLLERMDHQDHLAGRWDLPAQEDQWDLEAWGMWKII